ncbi:MAG: hypothetical protein IPK91_06125 [Saprospiraceae bacterium]|nr:hypothetical protein [Saprospiraceae bacterium]HRG68540.1 hypothetical protein [Saprospiraceae bacterium]
MPKEINYHEVLISPLTSFISEIGKDIAEAQQAMDSHSLELQKSIETSILNKELQDLGYQATWYQIPEVQVELKMAVYYEENETTETNKKKLFFTPFNAKYQNSYNYKSEGSSSIKVRIVPVPQPFSLEIFNKV